MSNSNLINSIYKTIRKPCYFFFHIVNICVVESPHNQTHLAFVLILLLNASTYIYPLYPNSWTHSCNLHICVAYPIQLMSFYMTHHPILVVQIDFQWYLYLCLSFFLHFFPLFISFHFLKYKESKYNKPALPQSIYTITVDVFCWSISSKALHQIIS